MAAKGLVDARPKVGTRINPQSEWNVLDPDVLEWIFETEPDPTTVSALFELRNLVEPAAAALAASRRTTTQLRAMRQALDDMAQHTLATELGRKADLAFHSTLLQATHNPFVIALATSVGAAIHMTTVYKQRAGHCDGIHCQITSGSTMPLRPRHPCALKPPCET